MPLGDRISSRLYDLLVRAPLRDVLGISKVRVAYSAGEPTAPDLLTFFRALGINLKPLYGSTETGFVVALPPDGEVRADTVGRPGRGGGGGEDHAGARDSGPLAGAVP